MKIAWFMWSLNTDFYTSLLDAKYAEIRTELSLETVYKTYRV